MDPGRAAGAPRRESAPAAAASAAAAPGPAAAPGVHPRPGAEAGQCWAPAAAPAPAPAPPSGEGSGAGPPWCPSPPRAARRQLQKLDVRVFCEVIAFVHDFPRLALVCRHWAEILRQDEVYFHVLVSLGHIDHRAALRPHDAAAAAGGPPPFAAAAAADAGADRLLAPRAAPWPRPAPLPPPISYARQWRLAYAHSAWRAEGPHQMVDFATSGVSNLSNDEGALSQIYYTYPRVGLQFKRKFALFGIAACTDLERIALKKGTHLQRDPVLEEAEYLVTGLALDRIVKLDFTTPSAPSGPCVGSCGATDGGHAAVTSVVVWTVTAVELFSCVVERHLTVDERRMKYNMVPVHCVGFLDTAPALLHSEILIIHINEDNIISILHCGAESRSGKLSVFRFGPPGSGSGPGQWLFTTPVPGPVRTRDGAAAPAGEGKVEWKSRERFEFKGSTRLGALIDDEGSVHVFHFVTRTWRTVGTYWWDLWKSRVLLVPDPPESGWQDRMSSIGPKPKYLRAAGDCVVFWNDLRSGSGPPLYFEVWRVRPRRPDGGPADGCAAPEGASPDSDQWLWASRVLCECYANITSVHIDVTRCFVHASRENKDVLVDVWDINMGRFVSRVHAVKNSWSMEKDKVKTYLSRLFWSSPDTVIYYELNTNHELSRNVLSFRQLSCVPKAPYWDLCRSLKGHDALKRETHRIISARRWEHADASLGGWRGHGWLRDRRGSAGSGGSAAAAGAVAPEPEQWCGPLRVTDFADSDDGAANAAGASNGSASS